MPPEGVNKVDVTVTSDAQPEPPCVVSDGGASTPHIGRVLRIVGDLAEHFPNHGPMLNERYLHHVFSHALQQAVSPDDSNLLDYRGPLPGITLHPEWPTCKKATGLLNGGCYARPDKKTFIPIQDGRKGGFIDFALGAYSCPEIGVEFMLKGSWSTEETVFDFMKLLDTRNSSFRHVVYLGIILRADRLPPHAEEYRVRADRALGEAARRLGAFFRDDGRRMYLVISEVGSDRRRHFYYDQPAGRFASSPGLPPFLMGAASIEG